MGVGCNCLNIPPISRCTKPLRGSFLAIMRCSVLSFDTLSCPSMGCGRPREPTHLFGNTHPFRLVAPSQRPLGALGSVLPHRQRSSYDTATYQDDPRDAMAAAGPQNPKGLCDRCRWLGQVLRLLSRSLESRANSYLPAPSPCRAAPGVEFLSSSGGGAAVLFYPDPGLGCPPPPPSATDGAVTAPPDPEHRGTPAPVD